MRYAYFTANSDEEAATSLESPDGPVSLFPTASFERIDPSMQVPRAEAFLTGAGEEAAADNPRSMKLVAEAGEGDVTVVTLTDEFRDAIADTDEARRRELADFWSRAEDLAGEASPEDLLPVVDELAALARQAKPTGAHLYCWVSV
ncbi:hypothetical protein [Amycolatopsis sp. FDAARGOS 1241]|uniref:hypothetical protein n=1 Tax=Amycolatopsis sp. FDAARGOS 1241 TaxID=2778070 RepID=UPI0019500908|nr:hypothetical protein [Amycolatopsis sp. FDAARGOS 1241]QRP48118.1 hypothetical protein I6J71_09665 [Amycolatopsis sp. FDAARGOS 1241]